MMMHQMPYQRIILVVRRLRDEDVACALDEVMATHVRHDLSAGKNLDTELLLYGVELLDNH